MPNPAVIYDACVLYPVPLRDLLMHLALVGLFRAKWTDAIHAEWTRNVLLNRRDLKPEQLQRTRELMNASVLDCLVTGYEHRIGALSLPDADDRDVLAAAIECGAGMIVTYNLADFPESALSVWNIEALHPDDFIVQWMDVDPASVVASARRQRASLKNPPRSVEEYLDTLANQKLRATVERLRELAVEL